MGPRPCPFVGCKHHLYLDVDESTGRIKFNFRSAKPDNALRVLRRMPETCSLDVADRGDITLERIGILLNLTRERVRQIETKGKRLLEPLLENPED